MTRGMTYLVGVDDVDESPQSHGINENMENSIFGVNINIDFSVVVEDVREKITIMMRWGCQ